MSNRIESDYFTVWAEDADQIGVFTFEDVDWLWREGKALLRSDPISRFGEMPVLKIAKRNKGYDYIPCGVVDLFSTRIVDLLRGEVCGEFLDFIALSGTMRMKAPGYMIFHAMDRFEAVDYERSDLIMWGEAAGGGIEKIRELYLRWDVIGESEVFYLTDAHKLCVSRRIRDRLLGVGAKGFRFTCLDDIATEYL
ncbi:hypothetical protein [Pandoraea pnomenusa]|uniref:imm11 family protein n=1 Tax=Pandoraea pnomenusa TaxID=93220 RepID=UPI00333F5BB1